MARVCVVGAGISGAACARVLYQAGIGVEIRERSPGFGGRMASPQLSLTPGQERPVDSGASYFTVSDGEDGEAGGFRRVVDDWLSRGLAREWTDTFHLLPAADGAAGVGGAKPGPMRYAAPLGLRTLVADLGQDVPIRTGTHVTEVGAGPPGPTVDGEQFDAVVLAMPDPQALRLLDADLTGERAALQGRPWEPVLALLAGFEHRSWADFDGGFVQDDETLVFVADDGRRRGDGAPVLVAHSTGDFAAHRLENPSAAAPPLAAALDRILGCGTPESTRVQRWTFARPTEERGESYLLSEHRIGLAGDGWGSPKVETAWKSGTDLGVALVESLR